MAIGGVQGPSQSNDLDKLSDDKLSQQKSSRLQLNITDQISQSQNEERMRSQLGTGGQQAQQDALRMFQMSGGPSSHEEIMSKLSPAQKTQAQNLTNQFVSQVKENVAAQFAAQKLGVATTEGGAPHGHHAHVPKTTDPNDPDDPDADAALAQVAISTAGPASASSADTAGDDTSGDDDDKNTSGLGKSDSKQMGSTLQGGINLSNSSTNTFDDPEVQQVIQGAVSGVYSQLYGLAQKMQGTLAQKQQLDNINSIYTNALATLGPPPATAMVPNYNISFNSQTGQMTATLGNPPQVPMTSDQIKAAQTTLSQTKDSMSDMSTMDQMNLQQLMEQKSQFEEVFSNMLKSFQDTASGLLANVKDS